MCIPVFTVQVSYHSPPLSFSLPLSFFFTRLLSMPIHLPLNRPSIRVPTKFSVVSVGSQPLSSLLAPSPCHSLANLLHKHNCQIRCCCTTVGATHDLHTSVHRKEDSKWRAPFAANTLNPRDTYTHLFLKELLVAKPSAGPRSLAVRARKVAGCANPNHRDLLKNLAVQCHYLSSRSLLKCSQLNKPCLPLGHTLSLSLSCPSHLFLSPPCSDTREEKETSRRTTTEGVYDARPQTHPSL